MKKLSNDLKRILAGLAFQDATEFCSMRDKLEVMGNAARPGKQLPASPTRVPGRCIAIISDGRGLGAPLSYAIDAALRQHAQIDLLVHGTTDAEPITALEDQIRDAGVDCRRIQLGPVTVDNIAGYIRNHSSLIFMVAMPDDAVARVLMEEVIPKRSSRIPVPLVLIEDQVKSRLRTQSAA